MRTTLTIATFVFVAGLAPHRSSPRLTMATVSAAGRHGELHITKNCAEYFAAGGAAGQFCTITSSDSAEIPASAATRVYYDQAFGLPPIGKGGFLDSNVLLYVGPSDWAVGRCTLDGNLGTGLCTFSDGVGALAGFRARLAVTPLPSGVDFAWDGTYSFRPEGEF